MGLKIQDIPKPRQKSKGKRKGRGIGSGRGKTSGKGHKGAKARSGGGTYNPGFEGGQMPLIRKMPKRGFTNKFKRDWCVLNLGRIGAIEGLGEGVVVDREFLIKKGILKNKRIPLKVLGKGTIDISVTIKANAFSDSARKAIESAGGTAEIVALKADDFRIKNRLKEQEK